jgi:hypothetical protein
LDGGIFILEDIAEKNINWLDIGGGIDILKL